MRLAVLHAVVVAVISQLFAKTAHADVVYLTNGRKIECLVKTQGRDTVELEVEVGSIRLRTTEINRIEKFTDAENQAMLKEWEVRKIQADAARKAWQEAEAARREQERKRKEAMPREVTMNYENGHMIASARINNSVNVRLLIDTGASLVVLSRAAGEKLGLVSAAETPAATKGDTVELTVADGRKVKAKYLLLDSVTVQDARAEEIEAAVVLDPQTEVLYDGVLGMSFLKRFNVQFNNKENKLILEKLK
ncbi:MAG TPA: retropepsin-like aspartic protease [Candidatus Omnitrophota bacterium]|nr:retropepsin-like aspartic protease [Candidatus Omnitrophota bacterium]HQJ15265.1 retropepsin-like aspartic protease [Candidatus Omnitrophota bacterium]